MEAGGRGDFRGEWATVFYMCYSVVCALPDFETEANGDSRSVFERVSFPSWSIWSAQEKYFPSLAGLASLVQENIFLPRLV